MIVSNIVYRSLKKIMPAVFVIIMTNGWAEEKNINPGINNNYYDAKFEQWLEVFETPGREVFDKKETILKEIQIKPGMRIADIGAGTGFYSIAFAQQTGKNGLVYAIDISSDFISNILFRAKNQDLNNIKGIINNQKEIGLSKNSIDLAFICDTYHHFEYPLTTLQSVYQSLNSGGKLIIIDFKRDPHSSSSWVMGHVRANKEKVITEVESIGFKLITESSILERNFFLTFLK